MKNRLLPITLAIVVSAIASNAKSEPPTTAFIFPAGAQRGTAVDVRIGGHFLHDKAEFTISGTGIESSSQVTRTNTIWFEGPLLFLPASQQKEDYPKDYAAKFKIAADAPPGVRYWHCSTSQGITPGMRFVVGELPEIIEDEVEGPSPAQLVTLPITINGRIFPREDVDDWSFEAKAGQVITCEVNAARIGSGLDSRLEALDPHGKVVAENSDTFGTDSFVRFKASADGKYVMRVHDIRFDGQQHFVYRLTISAGPWLDRVYPLGGKGGTTVPLQLFGANLPSHRFEFAVPPAEGRSSAPANIVLRIPPDVGTTNVRFETDEFAEHLEAEPNDNPSPAATIELPVIANGRIDKPGDVDLWKFIGKKGESWQFDLRASRLGSPLDGVLTLLNDKDQKIATADDIGNGQIDAVLTATLPADGTFTLVIEERISSRGGPEFAYRLRATKPGDAALRLSTALDAVSVARGGQTRLRVLAERPQGFADEIPLDIDGLPDGVTVTGNKIGKGQNQVDLVLKAEDSAKIATAQFRIVGKWKAGSEDRTTVATIQRQGDEALSQAVWLRVGLATPFKLKGVFETKYAPRGSVFTRKCPVERNGFTGPLWVEIADRQARYLQGVTGPRIQLAPDQSEFEYPLTFPPNMEIGRTSRSCLAVFGEVMEADGTKHIVSHTSQEQNEQAIAIVDPNRMSVETSQSTARFVPGSEVRIPIRVGRGVGLKGKVRVELLIPGRVRGVSAEALELQNDQAAGDLTLRFATDAALPHSTVALKLKATMPDERGLPVTDETEIRIVDAP